MDQISGTAASTDDGIAVVVLTHNRLHLLQKCVDNVLSKTSDATREIVIWDNASTDGTGDYLASLNDPRIRTITSPRTSARTGTRAPSERRRRRT